MHTALRKALAEQKKAQKAELSKRVFPAYAQGEERAERDGKIAFICGIFLPILIGVLLVTLILMLLAALAASDATVLILTYFLVGTSLAYLLFDILTAVFVVKSIIEARHEGISIPGETWTAMLLAGIPNFIFLALMLIALIIPWKRKKV